MHYRPDIDGLRTVAVVPVIVFHAGLGLSGGFVGVDVFFVISGYLITTLLLGELDENRFSLVDFYERRARRILPALFTVMALTTVAALLLMTPTDLVNYAKSAASTTAFLANIWFYTQEGYFTEAAELKPLLHTWSLGVEEQYYVLFPPLLWLAFRYGRSLQPALLLTLAGLLSFALSTHATATAPEAAFYLPQYRIWELLLGSGLALIARRGWLDRAARNRLLTGPLGLVGLAMIATAILTYGPETPFPGTAALLPCLGATLVIWSGTGGHTPSARLLSTPPMVWIGKLSYSLYLWHWPIIAFAVYRKGDDLSVTEGIACLALALLLSALSWRFVEQPFRDRKRLSRRAIFTSSAAAAAVVAVMATYVTQRDGLPARMPQAFLELTDTGPLMQPRADCHFVTPARAHTGDVCLRGAPDTPASFVFIGDSHAFALTPAIFTAAETLGLAGYQYTYPGFRPLAGVDKPGYPEFRQQVDALIAFLEARPEVETLYVTAFWQHQMTGYTYRTEGDIWTDDGYEGQGTAYNPTATLNGLRRLAQRLPDRRIVLLDDVPAGDALHLPTQARRLLFGHDVTLGLPRATADAQRATYAPAFERLARQSDQILYAPLLASLCGPEICPLFDGETLLFRDGDHLSHQGALRLTGAARDLLQRTLKAPNG
uniref:acyltransferase family protein n=1 Tax=Roseovarius indicus TaxID=540747 RepID=UPI003B515CA6